VKALGAFYSTSKPRRGATINAVEKSKLKNKQKWTELAIQT